MSRELARRGHVVLHLYSGNPPEVRLARETSEVIGVTEVGFLRLGVMGAPVAPTRERRTSDGVWNRCEGPVAALVAIGAAPAEVPCRAAEVI